MSRETRPSLLVFNYLVRVADKEVHCIAVFRVVVTRQANFREIFHEDVPYGGEALLYRFHQKLNKLLEDKRLADDYLWADVTYKRSLLTFNYVPVCRKDLPEEVKARLMDIPGEQLYHRRSDRFERDFYRLLTVPAFFPASKRATKLLAAKQELRVPSNYDFLTKAIDGIVK